MIAFPTINGTEVFRLPPDGYVVDFDHPKQQNVLEHYLVFGLGAPLAFTALLQRCYTKIFLSKGLQVDDGFMFLGWKALLCVDAAIDDYITRGGMCAHSWEMPLTNYEHYALLSYVAGPIYQFCNGFVKLSLLTFYLHLSPQKWFRIAVWSTIGIVSVYTVVITFMMFFLCDPPQKAFDFKVDGKCTDAAILYMATAVSNIVTDVMLVLLPIPMVYNLHMPKVQKMGAIAVFAIGSLTVITTSVIRLVKLPPVLASTDPSWDAAPANIWTFVEANLFVICGSLPTLRKFFKHFMPRFVGSSGGSGYGGASYGQNQQSNPLSRVRKGRSHYAQFPEDNGTELERFSNDDTKNGGTVIVGVGRNGGLRDDHNLTNQQRDELALIIAERSVVFFRYQDLSSQQQKELGEWYGEVEVHVPGVEGVTVTWPKLQATESPASFRQPGGASIWHKDLFHERQPAGITHLHNDVVPKIGGDTLWASGYASYEKLSPEFRMIIDGRSAIYTSTHPYLDHENPEAGPKFIERIHPLVRGHPATGWKALWVNRAMTDSIVGLDKAESDVILGYLFDVYEKSIDIQMRWKWTPRTSVLWENRNHGMEPE
ncbi:hypothetical protein FZEAL_4942 [Fusarium zealandicum]|uniref:Integral membrane protein n=1 Tax=Fusarium zealandicum TaxID=1053134 RepID=A0A8H4XKC0_9HYPO|nr:hypothetical protein FZEAL_4942 [Fusarium zealandicum]